MHPFERLAAWKLAHVLVLDIYRASKTFPADERHGLTAQTRRATVSIAANIAEGSGKRTRPEFRRFLDIALGSMTELECLLLILRDLEILEQGSWERIEERRAECGRVLWGLYRSMGKGRPPQAA
jgi:four helix bundle protein